MSEKNVVVKPGYCSTEFWLSLAAMLVGAIMASGVLEETATMWDNKVIGLIAMVLSGLGYTVSRTLTKGAAAKASAITNLGNSPNP